MLWCGVPARAVQVMAWYLMLAIAKTGVLDRLASGCALIGRRA